MDEKTTAFLDQCLQNNKSIEGSESATDSYSKPSISRDDIDQIFDATGGESTIAAGVAIGVSAVSA